MNFNFMDPTGIAGASPMPFMSQQTPADFLKSLQNFGGSPAMGNTRVTPPAVDFGLNPGAAYGSGSGFGQDVLSKSFLANESAPSFAGGGWGSGLWDSLKAFPGSDAGKLLLGGKGADGTTQMGLGGLAIGSFSALTNAMMGMKQFGLMKDQLKFSKESFAKNWEAQKTTTNSQLEDRQAARVASNAGAYQSVGEYMKKNGVK